MWKKWWWSETSPYITSTPLRSREMLQPFKLSGKVWKEVIIDFIDRLTRCEEFTFILEVIDRLSKYATKFQDNV